MYIKIGKTENSMNTAMLFNLVINWFGFGSVCALAGITIEPLSMAYEFQLLLS